MANLKEVKGRIVSVVSTQQITKAMKLVAAAKLRRAQDNILQMRPYAEKLKEILTNVSESLDSDEGNEYSKVRDPENVVIVVITSDRGLCGAFNANVCKKAMSIISKKYSRQNENGQLRVLTIGKKGKDFFKKRGYSLIDMFTGTLLSLSFENARKAAELLMQEFSDGSIDRVEIVYNEFKNITTQIVRGQNFLPLQSEEDAGENTSAFAADYIYQPSKQVIIEELIPKSLKVTFYKAVLESYAAEHGARMTAMDKATENADDLLRDLRLTYNRTRQAAITKEILEIVAGAEALG